MSLEQMSMTIVDLRPGWGGGGGGGGGGAIYNFSSYITYTS